MRIDSLMCRVLMLCVVVVTRVVMGIGVAVVVIMFVAGMFMCALFVIMFAASVVVVIFFFFCMIMRMLFATVPIVVIVIMGVEAGTFSNVELMNSRRIDQFDRYSILGHGFDWLLQRGSQFWPTQNTTSAP